MSTTSRRTPTGRRISLPAIVVALVLGLCMGGAAVASGRLVLGLGFVGIMVAFVAFQVIGSRFSDTIALLGDDIHEERHVHIHQRAALYTANIVALVVVGGGIVDIARGGDGGPWAFIAFVSGVTYVACLLVLSRRH
jgi:hypothetical protein